MFQQAYHVKLVLQRLAIVLLLYGLCRLLFYLFNMNHFESVGFVELLWIMFVGMRFDISAILYTNSLFLILHLVPSPFRPKAWYQLGLKSLFYFVNTITILLALTDLVYFEYTMKRTTADLMGIAPDVWNLLPQYLLDFWYLLIVLAVFLALAEWLYRKTDVSRQPSTNYIWQSSILVFSFIVFTIGARGGLQYIPISPITAVTYVDASKVPLVTNTPFTFMYSFSHKGLDEKTYFNQKQLQEEYPIYHQYSHYDKIDEKNVVLIIMESLSIEYTGLSIEATGHKSYTPFLDSLAKHGYYCPSSFANGKHSNEGLVAITASIPALMNDAFINSVYQDNNLKGLASMLKPLGYQTAFFHGGNNGTFGFDYFSKAAGFDKYYGREEYSNDADFDGYWGIYDDAFFEYFADELNKMDQPFCTGIFSLSAHHPYSIPEKYGDQFDEDFEMHRNIRFADHALRKFFAKARKQDWYNNTLFVITADHTGPARSPKYKTPIGIYRIPILFYEADGRFPSSGINVGIVQQTDILPSILDYLGYDKPYTAFGRSIFQNVENIAFNYLNGIYQIINDKYVLQFDGTRSVAMYDHIKDPLLKNNILSARTEIKASLELKLKAVIQQYHTALIHNRLAGR